MPTVISSLERLQQLQAEIVRLQHTAIQELMDKRNAITRELAAVDADIAKLTGKPVAGRKTGHGRIIPLHDLKELLAAAPERTLSIRKEKLEVSNIKNLAKLHPIMLRIGGKGAWPTITLR
jgi:hypothetical protein